MRCILPSILLMGTVLLFGGRADGQGKGGQTAPDFPPGQFSDGNYYQLSDLRGKVVVLYFYEKG